MTDSPDQPELTVEAGQRALLDHAVDRARLGRRRHGPVDWAKTPALLADREVVRYPTELTFASAPLTKPTRSCDWPKSTSWPLEPWSI